MTHAVWCTFSECTRCCECDCDNATAPHSSVRCIDHTPERLERDTQTKMDFPEGIDYAGRIRPLLMIKSGIYIFEEEQKDLNEPTPVEAAKIAKEAYVPAGLILVQKANSGSGNSSLVKLQKEFKTVKPTTAQGMELIRRPDRDGR